MYVTINVTIAVAVSVMMKVTVNVIVVTAPVDNESDPAFLDSHKIPYTYKFSRDVNFADDPNLGFSRFYFRGSLAITPCTSSVLQVFYKISRI